MDILEKIILYATAVVTVLQLAIPTLKQIRDYFKKQ